MPPTNRADIVAALAGDLGSPRVIATIDKIVTDLLDLRKIAVSIHGDNTPPPALPALTPPTAHEGPAARPTAAALDGARQQRLQQLELVGISTKDGEITIGTVAWIVYRYRTDERSMYNSLRFRTRENYDSLIKRILKDCADRKLADLKQPDILEIYEEWTSGGRTVPIAHSLITMFRTLISFGAVILEDRHCERLSVILHRMKFEAPKPRAARLTETQANAVRDMAHKMGHPSMAIAQAFQFDCGLHQKDVIGEWVPVDEPGVSAVIANGMKWLRGLRWNEIDKDLILHHVTSKGGHLIERRLSETQMVKAELDRYETLPQSGPIIINELTGYPYLMHQYRRLWRKIARAAGVPDDVYNRDSRIERGEVAAENEEATEAAAP